RERVPEPARSRPAERGSAPTVQQSSLCRRPPGDGELGAAPDGEPATLPARRTLFVTAFASGRYLAPVHPRAERLIHDLKLTLHPEGGWFREVFRSDRSVRSDATLSPRSALTTIYFLLVEGQASRWHRVIGDEAWHFYE